jgi:taurine dioxygenase
MPPNPNRQTAGHIDITRLSAAIGAQVECGDVKSLDADTFAGVHQAFLDNLVLLIRGQQLTDDDLLAFGRRFGGLSPRAAVHRQKPRDERTP